MRRIFSPLVISKLGHINTGRFLTHKYTMNSNNEIGVGMDNEDDEGNWLSSWEQQCGDSIEEQPDYEQNLITEIDMGQRRMWNSFQDSATAIAQLYRDRYASEPASVWLQFQTAAGTVTSLYKESCETLKKSTELAKQSGYQKRNTDLYNWAKRKRRLIRREDLLAFLAGKPLPPAHIHLHRHHHHLHHPHLHRYERHQSVLPTRSQNGSPDVDIVGFDANLHTFREALTTSRSAPGSEEDVLPRETGDLCAFITGEMARHCAKRPASPSPGLDVTMGSPTPQKKTRYM